MTDQREDPKMIQLYRDWYEKGVSLYGSKVVVLLQVGGFYEMYDILDINTNTCSTNIREVVPMLEISLKETHVKGYPHLRRLFAGFPDYALNKYERLIVNRGYRAYIISQKRDGRKIERMLDHISSAGTFIDSDDSLVRDKWIYAFLCEASVDMFIIHAAGISCSTGKTIICKSTVCTRETHLQLDEIVQCLSTYEPAEIIVWATADAQQLGVNDGWIRDNLQLINNVIVHIRIDAPRAGDARREEEILTRSFAMERNQLLHILELDRKPELRKTLASLLAFIEEHNPALISRLELPTDFSSTSDVRLGNHALEQVGMVNLQLDKSHECLYHFFNKCNTAIGKRSMRGYLLRPIFDVKTLRERINKIGEWRHFIINHSDKVHTINSLMRKMYDTERIYRKMQLGTININDITRFITTFEMVKQIDIISGSLNIQIWTKDILDFAQKICEIWNLDKLEKIKDGCAASNGYGADIHPWNSGISTEQDQHEASWHNIILRVNQILEDYKRIIGDDNAIVRGFGDDEPIQFIATKKRCERIISELKSNGKHATIGEVKSAYCVRTAEMNTLNEKALSIRKQWSKSYEEYFMTAIMDLKTMFSKINESFTKQLGLLDIVLTLATCAEEYGYCMPEYHENQQSGIYARELRHGILERIRKDVAYVPHTVALGSLAKDEIVCSSPAGVLLFGVNSSGKSSLMKAIGLSVLLAQAGCPVPASEYKIVPYKNIFTRILGNDNLWAGMSSFVVEMTEFRSILKNADENSLVLGDELCAGTETASAAALVAAGLQTLSSKKVNFFFATHLHELQSFNELVTNPNVKWLHLRVRYDDVTGQLIYDRDLHVGAGDMMYGLEVCRALRMPPDFLDLAMKFRRRLQGFSDDGSLDAPVSRYNSTVFRETCEICNKPGHKNHEVHHIVPQKLTKNGKIAPGIHKNHKSNLVVLCSSCHDRHHNGQLNIIGWKETSAGRRLVYEVHDGDPN